MKKYFLISMLSICSIGLKSQILTENFESTTFPPTGWTLQSTNTGFTWKRSGNLPISGTRSASVEYDPAPANQDEKLITPSFSLAGVTSATLTFKSVFNPHWAMTPNDNYDTLVKVSTDNGTTWTQIWSENDITVATPPGFALYNISIPLTSVIGQNNVKIAFNYVGNDGAEWKVDDINITTSTLGVSEEQIQNEVSVYPNPVDDSFKIDLPKIYNKNKVSITLFDMSGKKIKDFDAGNNSYNVSGLAKGVYIIVISDDTNKTVKKIEKR